MNCPRCGYPATCISTQHKDEPPDYITERVRRCPTCDQVFKTVERIVNVSVYNKSKMSADYITYQEYLKGVIKDE